MEKQNLGAWWRWVGGVVPALCITAICVIAAWSDYCVSISAVDGFQFAVCR
jgi:hypothetical protein